MTWVVRWLLASSIRYSYLFVRALLRLPLLLLPVSPRIRNQVAGAVAAGLWFFSSWFVATIAGAPWWGQLMIIAAAALVIAGVVRMEGRRPVVRRPARVR